MNKIKLFIREATRSFVSYKILALTFYKTCVCAQKIGSLNHCPTLTISELRPFAIQMQVATN